jgi:lysophospholipase L1-like esterase
MPLPSSAALVNGGIRWCQPWLKFVCAVPLAVAAGFLVVGWFVTRPQVDYSSPTPTEDASRDLMVTLGDSFTSGEGAKKYLAGTSNANNTCHRANSAYPFVVAQQLDWRLVTAACSGALTIDITKRGQHPQSSDTTFGARPQIEALSASDLHSDPSEVDVVVLSIGGNDAGFADVVKTCAIRNCLPQTAGWMAQLNELDDDLYETYSAVTDVVPDARKLVMTYPDIIAPGSCLFGRLTPAEVAWVRLRFLPRLDQIIGVEATNAGFEVVDNTNAFLGARICEDGVPASNEAANTIAAEQLAGGGSLDHGDLVRGSFHPNPIGHQLLAADLLRALEQDAPDITACGPFSACPGVPRAPSDEPLPGTEQPFPEDAPCTGDQIDTQHVAVIDQESTWPLTAKPQTRYCYREWGDRWRSGDSGSNGRVEISTVRLVNEQALAIEVLTEQSDGTWTRTVLNPTPLDHPPGEVDEKLLNVLTDVIVVAVVVGVALLALAALPWIACWRRRQCG